MSDRICIHLRNGAEEDLTATVEDLGALHLPRYPLIQGVWEPREQQSIYVTRDASFPGMASSVSGCIRVFSPNRVPRTLTVCEGDVVVLE